MDDTVAPLDDLADALRDADTAVALTGAGISKPSGLPTYRGNDGIWREFGRETFCRTRFEADPSGYWEDRIELREAVYADGRPDPNVAHEALAELDADGHLDGILTQNVDGLHRDAGSADVLELHGTDRTVSCDECGDRVDADPVFERASADDVPPRCDCGGIYRPDVLMYGEEFPDDRFERARSLADSADWLLVAGSSLMVQGVRDLPKMAAEGGGTVAIVNLERTPADAVATHVLRRDVTDVLPALAERV